MPPSGARARFIFKAFPFQGWLIGSFPMRPQPEVRPKEKDLSWEVLAGCWMEIKEPGKGSRDIKRERTKSMKDNFKFSLLGKTGPFSRNLSPRINLTFSISDITRPTGEQERNVFLSLKPKTRPDLLPIPPQGGVNFYSQSICPKEKHPSVPVTVIDFLFPTPGSTSVFAAPKISVR